MSEHPKQPLDELLRQYLATDPGATLRKILDEQQASEQRIKDAFAEHERKDDERHLFLVEKLGDHRARIERLERKASEPPKSMPKTIEPQHWVEKTGTYDVPKEDAKTLLEAYDRAKDAEKWASVVKFSGKVALALVSAAALGLGGYIVHALTH